MNHKSLFFKYVIPSIIAFALSGIYAIVDGYFVGNTIGDAGLSAINIAYPIEALIQALGTGIGMGGAVYYSINAAEKKGKRADELSSVMGRRTFTHTRGTYYYSRNKWHEKCLFFISREHEPGSNYCNGKHKQCESAER